MFNDDKQIWPAVRNTLWLVVFAVPLKVMFAFGVAVMLTRARRGIGVFRTIFYLPALAPPVAATLGFVYLLNPATGPVNQVLSAVGIDGPLWFNDPHWSKPALTLLLDVGHRQPDDHLPRGAARRAAAPVRVGGARRRRRVAAAALGDAARRSARCSCSRS